LLSGAHTLHPQMTHSAVKPPQNRTHEITLHK